MYYRRGGTTTAPQDAPPSENPRRRSSEPAGKGKRKRGGPLQQWLCRLFLGVVTVMVIVGGAAALWGPRQGTSLLGAPTDLVGAEKAAIASAPRTPLETVGALHKKDPRQRQPVELTVGGPHDGTTNHAAAVHSESYSQTTPTAPPLSSSSCGTNTTQHWRRIAVELARLPPKRLLAALDEKDPFGVRKFEAALIEQEIALGRTLTVPELQKLFPCPRNCLLTPHLDVASLPAPRAFREGRTWMLFQHLRKAGGTHFCSLAESNLPKKALPSYYCMPDYRWSNWSCAGCLHHWSNDELTNRMTVHRVAGNEWDNFAKRFLDLPEVVLATSFRKPLDRALSQFRFECVEGRGCKILNVTRWWERRKDLYNVYTTTFADAPALYGKLQATYLDPSDANEQADRRGELLGAAFDVVLQLHLVLCMEWLAYAGPHVSAVLGFHNTAKLTQRVRPHLSQRQRPDQPDTNALGAAGTARAGWDPKTYLSPQQFNVMSESLALDMILTDAARRIFLERVVCAEDGAAYTASSTANAER